MTDFWKQKVTIYNDIPKTAVEERHFDRFVIDKCNIQGGIVSKADGTVEKPIVSSKSQSAGGVSESESYSVKTADDYLADLERIFEPLGVVKTANGIRIDYRGAMS